MTQGQLEEKLASVGINGKWIKPDDVGFSRNFQFELNEQIIEIEWYWNISTLIIGNAHFWFDTIDNYSGYPRGGKWIEFSLRGEHPLHLKVSE